MAIALVLIFVPGASWLFVGSGLMVERMALSGIKVRAGRLSGVGVDIAIAIATVIVRGIRITLAVGSLVVDVGVWIGVWHRGSFNINCEKIKIQVSALFEGTRIVQLIKVKSKRFRVKLSLTSTCNSCTNL